jgi:hypothetical protein
MRTFAIAIGAVAILMMSSAATRGQSADWRLCPVCMTQEQNAQATEQAKKQRFDPHDISGLWGVGTLGFNLSQNTVPPMTPWGQARYDAAKPGLGRRGTPLGNDPMMICDPLGYPRWFTYNYGMEFVVTPGRVFQFFEYGHAWRTIYTDGRKLPDANDVDPRFLGYAVGKWAGDTFVVESTGFDDRSWLDQDGHPHSQSMHLTEYYRRTGPDAMEVTVMIDDPMAYTRSWKTDITLKLNPAAEVGEYFCVPSDEETFKKKMREPAGGAK